MPERLIDKAKLLEYLAAIKPDEYVSAYGEAAVDVINHVEIYVNEMPTIEAEPIRHGRWIIKRDEFYTAYNMYYAECSECKHTESTGMAERIKYCPNCGARMDGGADNG